MGWPIVQPKLHNYQMDPLTSTYDLTQSEHPLTYLTSNFAKMMFLFSFRLSANYYVNRDGRREVAPPQVLTQKTLIGSG